MSNSYALDKIPEIDLLNGTTILDSKNEIIDSYKSIYKEETGQEIELIDADTESILFSAMALMDYQLEQKINETFKQNFLKYAHNENLENVAGNIGVVRLKESKAVTMLRFYLQETMNAIVVIPQGTQITDRNSKVFFSTKERSEISIGKLFVDVIAECTESGTIGNNIQPGVLNVLVDLVPYIDKVTNILVTEGGSDVESDEDLAERAYLSPQGFSSAGPEGAYIYWTKSFSQLIKDVKVTEPFPGGVGIIILLKEGNMPSETFIEELKDYLKEKGVRPLNDQVLVEGPAIIEYDVELEYFISKKSISMEETIKGYVESSVDEFIEWQKEKIGKDINPSYLYKLIMDCGVKRLEVKSPTFLAIDNSKIAVAKDINIIYRGLEDE